MNKKARALRFVDDALADLDNALDALEDEGIETPEMRELLNAMYKVRETLQ